MIQKNKFFILFILLSLMFGCGNKQEQTDNANRKRTFIDCGESEACVKTIPVLGQQAKRASTSVSDDKRFLMPQHSFTTGVACGCSTRCTGGSVPFPQAVPASFHCHTCFPCL